jgi:hypothetical protein
VPAEIWEFADPRHRRIQLVGLAVEALDAPLGRVTDASHGHEASYLVVERRRREALVVPAGLVERVDERESVVYLDRTNAELDGAPVLAADREPTREQILRLAGYYGPRSPRSLGVGRRKVSRLRP